MRRAQRAIPSGRPNVRNKLDWIRKTRRVDSADGWDRFIVALWPWISGRTFLPAATPSGIEEALWRLGSTPYDGLIPWLWREWRAALKRSEAWGGTRIHKLARAEANLVVRPLLRDWYAGARPDIMRFTYAMAVEAADDWHAVQEAAALAQPSRALTSTELDDFPLVQVWPDGFWIGNYSTLEDASHRNLQALGRILGHCYQDSRLAHEYGDYLDLWVLFDDKNRPHWTCATRSKGDRANPNDIREILEIKAKGNSPVLPKHFPYLRDFLQPAMQQFGMPDDVYDYANADGLYEYTRHETVVWHGAGRLTFTGKDDRHYWTDWAGGDHAKFHLMLSCSGHAWGLDGPDWARLRPEMLQTSDTLDQLLQDARDAAAPC